MLFLSKRLVNPGNIVQLCRFASYPRIFGFSLFQSQSSKSRSSSLCRALSTFVFYFTEIPNSLYFKRSYTRALYLIAYILSLPRVIFQIDTAFSTKIRPLAKSLLVMINWVVLIKTYVNLISSYSYLL